MCSWFMVDDYENPTSVVDLERAVSAEDAVTVTVLSPVASIVVEPEFDSLLVGERANFDVTITNTGDAALSDIRVSHVQIPDCDGRIQFMRTGEQHSYSCSLDEITEDFPLDVNLSADVGDTICEVEANGSGEVEMIPLSALTEDQFLPFISK